MTPAIRFRFLRGRGMSSPTTNQTAIVGWQSEPNVRGTYEILKSCLGTVALLCWSSVCPNVPPLDGGSWRGIRGKLTLFLLAILMPEAVLWVALGQLYIAWCDKRAFKARRGSAAGHANDDDDDWGLRQCFFVNMGGLFIQFLGHEGSSTSGEEEEATATWHQSPFPVNCKQLRRLADLGFLTLPTITPADIEMRNKSNGLARTITIVQVLWFTVATLARLAQGLPITTLERTTLSLVLIMVFSAAAWWRKPMDITHPIVLPCRVALATVLATIKDPSSPPGQRHSRHFGATPLSFYDRQEWIVGKAWASYTSILRTLLRQGGRPAPSRRVEKDMGSGSRPFPNAFPSVELPQVALALEASAGMLTQAYSCVLLSAWSDYFPTSTERLLWRISTTVGVAFGFLGCAIAVLDRYGSVMGQCCGRLWRRLRKMMGCGGGAGDAVADSDTELPETPLSEQGRRTSSAAAAAPAERAHSTGDGLDWLRRISNLSPYQDPNFDTRLRFWIPATLLCMTYSVARAFIIVEDFASLRRQPVGTYEVVDWGQYTILF